MKICDKVTWKPLGDKVVAVKVETGEYYTMNEVASLIWKAVDAGKNAEETADMICAEYEVTDRAAVLQDVEEQIAEWKKEGLMQ